MSNVDLEVNWLDLKEKKNKLKRLRNEKKSELKKCKVLLNNIKISIAGKNFQLKNIEKEICEARDRADKDLVCYEEIEREKLKKNHEIDSIERKIEEKSSEKCHKLKHQFLMNKLPKKCCEQKHQFPAIKSSVGEKERIKNLEEMLIIEKFETERRVECEFERIIECIEFDFMELEKLEECIMQYEVQHSEINLNELIKNMNAESENLKEEIYRKQLEEAELSKKIIELEKEKRKENRKIRKIKIAVVNAREKEEMKKGKNLKKENEKIEKETKETKKRKKSAKKNTEEKLQKLMSICMHQQKTHERPLMTQFQQYGQFPAPNICSPDLCCCDFDTLQQIPRKYEDNFERVDSESNMFIALPHSQFEEQKK